MKKPKKEFNLVIKDLGGSLRNAIAITLEHGNLYVIKLPFGNQSAKFSYHTPRGAEKLSQAHIKFGKSQALFPSQNKPITEIKEKRPLGSMQIHTDDISTHLPLYKKEGAEAFICLDVKNLRPEQSSSITASFTIVEEGRVDMVTEIIEKESVPSETSEFITNAILKEAGFWLLVVITRLRTESPIWTQGLPQL